MLPQKKKAPEKLCALFAPCLASKDSKPAELNALLELIGKSNFRSTMAANSNEAAQLLGPDIAVAVFYLQGGESSPEAVEEGGQWLSKTAKSTFRVVYSNQAAPDAALRDVCATKYYVHMVTDVFEHFQREIAAIGAENMEGPFTCSVCNKTKLTEYELWRHAPQYHVNEKKTHSAICPVCKNAVRALLPHIYNAHGPPGIHSDERKLIPLCSFGLCVIQRKSDKKFLVVQEYNNQGFWLPGGGIDPGEFPTTAAIREAKEEAGIDVKLTGLLRVEYSPSPSLIRQRYIFFGEPVDEKQPAKTFPDFESFGACWVSATQVAKLRLRGSEPLEWFTYVANGGPIFPINLLTYEGEPPPTLE